MAEIKKFSLVEELKKADDTLQGDPSLTGMTMLTYPGYINAMRSTMFTSHLKQFLNLVNPDFPLVFTNNENLVGKHSTGYKQVKNRVRVYRKVAKYERLVDKPKVYQIFLYDEDNDTYDVEERKVCENLTENFGYEYINDVIDSLQEGDIVDPGTVLFKSTSYDEDMNYAYGKNITVAYTLDPFTSEDAAVASKSLCNEMTSIETEEIRIGLNDNQYLLNRYGDKNHYIPLPPIGTKVSDMLAISRKKFNNQILFDFKDSSLNEIHEGDDIFWIDKNSEIIDYTIYSNCEVENTSSFYEQINELIREQKRYYKEIVEICEDIMHSGSNYSDELDYLYKRSLEMLDDDNKKWRDGDNEFSNMKIVVSYERHVPLAKGSKITGRFGNKSVISEIRDDEDMPFTEDGRRVDLLLNLLAIINRTTSFLLFELFINGCSYKVRQHMKTLNTLEEKEEVLFSYIDALNSNQSIKMYKDYKKLKKKEKEAYINDAINDGILIHQQSMWEDKAIFYKALELRQKFPYIKKDKVYIKKWGKVYPVLSDYFIGEMYCIKLKQSDRRGFSARSTGAIDNKSLPTRSFKSKSHLEKTSSSCIRFGEFETLNFSIGIVPEDIALFHSLYRTSIKGRKDLLNMMFSNDNEGVLRMDRTYKSRVSEIFNVTLKSMGIELNFIDEDDEVVVLNKNNMDEHELNGTTYICSDYQFFVLKRIARIREEILLENPVITNDELEKLVDERVMKDKLLDYNYKQELEDLKIDVAEENKRVYEKLLDAKMESDTAHIVESLESINNEVNIMDV